MKTRLVSSFQIWLISLSALILAGPALAQAPQSRFVEANGVRLHYLLAGTGSPIVLLHDGGGPREQTVEALEKLIPWLAEQGYRFGFPVP